MKYLVGIIIFFTTLGLITYGLTFLGTNTNLDNPEVTKTESLKESDTLSKLTYTLPTSWKKSNYSSDTTILIESENSIYDPAERLTKGAKIIVDKTKINSKDTSLNKIAVESLAMPLQKNPPEMEIVEINGKQYVHFINNWEGFFDAYITVNDGTAYRMYFTCASCIDKKSLDTNVYKKDWDSFLQSIKFD